VSKIQKPANLDNVMAIEACAKHFNPSPKKYAKIRENTQKYAKVREGTQKYAT